MRHARAAIVRAEAKGVEAERTHHRHLVGRHRALGIFDMMLGTARFRAVAIAAQIRRDHREVFCQLRGHLVPHHVGLGMTVQKQERWAAAADDAVYGDVGDFNAAKFEAFKHARRYAALVRVHAGFLDQWSPLVDFRLQVRGQRSGRRAIHRNGLGAEIG